jgi:hypothetical protein
MFNKAYTHWSPFTIPPTPTIPSGSTDSYGLSCDAGADGSKNPSQFLKWKKLGGGALPAGSNVGDLIYWDGEAWVVLNAPSEAAVGNEKFIYWDGSSWLPANVRVFDICENGTAKQYRIPAIENI